MSTVPGVAAPIVRVQVLKGDVTIRTWDRPDVQVEGDPTTFTVEHHVSRFGRQIPPVPISPGLIEGPNGPITIPAESFVVSTVPPGERDVIVVKGTQVGPMTVTVPNDTALVGALVGNGSLLVDGYHGGTLIAHVRSGKTTLRNVSGDAFVQQLRGPLLVSGSTFDRLRARGALGKMVFENCNAHQIEVTNVEGSILYDRGTFVPGLARFDSVDGDVSIGVESSAQLSGHIAGPGHVYTMFDPSAQVDNHDSAATVQVNGGGAVVNATSGNGSVYLYDASARSRGDLAPEWNAMFKSFRGSPSQPAPSSRYASPSYAPPHYTSPRYTTPHSTASQSRPYVSPWSRFRTAPPAPPPPHHEHQQ